MDENFEKNKKNMLVSELDDGYDGALFRYSHIYRSSNSILTSKIMTQLKLEKVLAYLALGTFLVFYVLNRKNYYKSENQTTIRPTIAAVSEPASLNRNTLPIATSRFASMSCSLPFQIRTPQSSEPKVIFCTRPALGLTHSQVQKAGVKQTAREQLQFQIAVAQHSAKPQSICRNVSTAAIGSSSEDSDLEQKTDKILGLIDKHGRLIFNPTKEVIKPPDMLDTLKNNFINIHGPDVSTKGKDFVDYSREYLVNFIREKQRGKMSDQQQQNMASDILIFQLLDNGPIAKIEDAWSITGNFMIEYIEKERTIDQLPANKKVDAKKQLDENLAAKRDQIKNIFSLLDSNDVPFFDYLTQEEKRRLPYVHFYKEALNKGETIAGVIENQDTHLHSKKAGGSVMGLNMGTMSMMDHCICTELESLVSQETGLPDGGIPMRKKLATQADSLRNVEKLGIDAAKAYDLIESKLDPIKTRASKIDWKLSTALPETSGLISRCTKFKSKNAIFIKENEELIRSLCMSVGTHVCEPLALSEGIKSKTEKNPLNVAFASKIVGHTIGENLAKMNIERYHKNLKLSNSLKSP